MHIDELRRLASESNAHPAGQRFSRDEADPARSFFEPSAACKLDPVLRSVVAPLLRDAKRDNGKAVVQ